MKKTKVDLIIFRKKHLQSFIPRFIRSSSQREGKAEIKAWNRREYYIHSYERPFITHNCFAPEFSPGYGDSFKSVEDWHYFVPVSTLEFFSIVQKNGAGGNRIFIPPEWDWNKIPSSSLCNMQHANTNNKTKYKKKSFLPNYDGKLFQKILYFLYFFIFDIVLCVRPIESFWKAEG